MSHGPGFGNSCIRRSVSSNRWPGSPWLLRICLGLFYIALSKEICHRRTVRGSFNPSPRECCGSTLCLCSQSLLSHLEPTGCLVGAQHCGAHFRQSEEEASDLWHVRVGRANPRVWPQCSHCTACPRGQRGEQSRVGNNFWSGQRCLAHNPSGTGG